MVDRPSIDSYFMAQVLIVSSRGSCARRKVGCILVDSNKYVLATGYNGPPSSMDCSEALCPCRNSVSGSGLDGCMAIHAEQNALLQCRELRHVHTAYVTASPCIICTKMLLNTSCERIVFLEDYPHSSAKDLWISSGRKWQKIEASSLLEVEKLFDATLDALTTL